MNKTNPLFILLVSLIVVLMGAFFVLQEKENLKNAKVEYSDFQNIASAFKDKQKSYQDIKIITKRLETIIKKSNIKNANISQTKTKISLTITNNNINVLDGFVNKLLNDKFNIKKFELSSTRLHIEIGVL